MQGGRRIPSWHPFLHNNLQKSRSMLAGQTEATGEHLRACKSWHCVYLLETFGNRTVATTTLTCLRWLGPVVLFWLHARYKDITHVFCVEGSFMHGWLQ